MFYGWQFFAWNICSIFLAIGNSKILAIDMCEIFAYWKNCNERETLIFFYICEFSVWNFVMEWNELLTHTMNSWWFIESFSAYGTKFSLMVRWLRPTMRYGIFYYTWCYARTRCHNAWDTFFVYDEVTHCRRKKGGIKSGLFFLVNDVRVWILCVCNLMWKCLTIRTSCFVHRSRSLSLLIRSEDFNDVNSIHIFKKVSYIFVIWRFHVIWCDSFRFLDELWKLNLWRIYTHDIFLLTAESAQKSSFIEVYRYEKDDGNGNENKRMNCFMATIWLA